jgi:hypothetical protein
LAESFVVHPEEISPIPQVHKVRWTKKEEEEASACIVTDSPCKNELEMALRRKEGKEN